MSYTYNAFNMIIRILYNTHPLSLYVLCHIRIRIIRSMSYTYNAFNMIMRIMYNTHPHYGIIYTYNARIMHLIHTCADACGNVASCMWKIQEHM